MVARSCALRCFVPSASRCCSGAPALVTTATLAVGEGPLRLVVPGSPGLSIKQRVRLGQR